MAASTDTTRRAWLKGLLASLALAAVAWPVRAGEGFHQLVLYISDNDPARMSAVLDIAANVSRHYSASAEEVEIEIVAFGPGVQMFLAGTSPVAERLRTFMPGMINVTLVACGNTLDTMARHDGQRPALLPDVDVVQVGVAHLMQRAEEGWTVIRP